MSGREGAPMSLRMSSAVVDRLARVATRTGQDPAALAERLVDEGLRTLEHPGVVFVGAGPDERTAALLRGPGVAEVLDVLTGLAVPDGDRISETAAWFDLEPSEVRTAVTYAAAFRTEVEEQVRIRWALAAAERDRLARRQVRAEDRNGSAAHVGER